MGVYSRMNLARDERAPSGEAARYAFVRSLQHERVRLLAELAECADLPDPAHHCARINQIADILTEHGAAWALERTEYLL